MVVCCQGSLSAVVSKNIRMNNLVVRVFFCCIGLNLVVGRCSEGMGLLKRFGSMGLQNWVVSVVKSHFKKDKFMHLKLKCTTSSLTEILPHTKLKLYCYHA